jgi:hypothetical protein
MDKIINWLLEGDPAIRFKVHKNLLSSPEKKIISEQKKIAEEGWGKKLLSYQAENGIWGKGLYSPKWISTTYTMLLLKNLGLPENNKQAEKACEILLNKGFMEDGGINYSRSMECSETCITGLILGILSYFNYKDDRIHELAGHLLNKQMDDGGWNCQWYRGAVHSSFHTTINVMEALREYEKRFPKNSLVIKAQAKGKEFLLLHRLYKSHRTGEIVHPKLTVFFYPAYWHYDIYRAFDYFNETNSQKDERMDDAMNLLIKKQNKDGTWNIHGNHGGKIYFEMEKKGKPSRMNTLRALTILKWFNNE